MSNSYLTLKAKHKNELHAIPIRFAFCMRQFEDAMKELGLTPNDTDKIYRLPGGGFIRKTDAKAFTDMLKRFSDEKEAAITADADGTGYIFEMFDYELRNHEYGYTHDPEPTLDALGLTIAEVEANPVMSAAFKRAKAAQFKGD